MTCGVCATKTFFIGKLYSIDNSEMTNVLLVRIMSEKIYKKRAKLN